MYNDNMPFPNFLFSLSSIPADTPEPVRAPPNISIIKLIPDPLCNPKAVIAPVPFSEFGISSSLILPYITSVSVVKFPELSINAPKGNFFPPFWATITFPSATVEVAISKMMWGDPLDGIPIDNGDVLPLRSLPPKGATSKLPLTFTKWKEINPASAALSDQSPILPRWPEFFKPITDIPCFAALVIPSSTAYSPATCPKPCFASSKAIAPASTIISGLTFGKTQFQSIHCTYLGTLTIPWLSWPFKFEPHSLSAIVLAS